MSPGSRFGRFEIQDHEGGGSAELSHGALGTVYAGTDGETGAAVALSVIAPGIFASAAVRDAAVEAARQAVALRQLHAAAVLDAGAGDGGEMYHAAERCTGTDVQGMVVEEGALSALQAVGLAAQVGMALAAAEAQGLAHGSLSPGKMVLTLDADGDTMVKVTGFGLPCPFAPGVHPPGDTAALADLSSFISPEQWQGQPAGCAGDVYALGACLWFMLAGQAPLEGAVTRVKSQALAGALPWENLAGQPQPVTALMRRLLAADPAGRPTAAQACQELQQCFAHLAAADSAQAGAPDLADTASFHERFSLESDLGPAPMGHLYRAVDAARPEAMAAVLQVDPKFTATAAMRQNLEEQLAAARQNPSRGWSLPLDFTWTPEGLVIATDWQEGVTLRGLLTQRGWLPPAEALPLLERMAAIADDASACGVGGLNLAPQEIHFHAVPSAGLVNWATLLNLPLHEWPQYEVVAGAVSPAGKFHPVAAIGRLACETMGGMDAALQAAIPGLGEPANLLLRKAAANPGSFASATALVGQVRQEFQLQPVVGSPVMAPAAVAAGFPPPRPRKNTGAPVFLIAGLTLAVVATLGAGYYISRSKSFQSGGPVPGAAVSSPPAKPAPSTVPHDEEEDLKALMPQDGVESDPNSPMAKTVRQALKGDAYAQALLGWELVSAPGTTPEKIRLGRKWLEKSAGQDHPLGLYLAAEQEWQDLKADTERALPFQLSAKFSQAGSHGFRTQVGADDYVWQAALGRAFFYGLGTRRDVEEAKRWFAKAAKGGDVTSVMMLADLSSADRSNRSSIATAMRLYSQLARHHGDVPATAGFARLAGIFPVPWQDLEDAGSWIGRDANEGNREAEFLMGLYQEQVGTSGKPDPVGARDWYRKAADLGSPQAKAKLGAYNMTLPTKDFDAQTTFRLLDQARDGGALEACWHLGNLYRWGSGVSKDGKKAAGLYLQGMEAGDPRAADAYAMELRSGDNVPENERECTRILARLADAGDAQGTYDLAFSYRFGIGVEKDYPKAHALTMRAAELGQEDSLVDAGECYQYGDQEPRDPQKALRCFQQSIDQGNRYAHFNAGYMLEMGDGVPVNLTAAAEHYRQDAEAPDPRGMINLGLMYARGEGVPKDEAKAVKLYGQAVERDNGDAMVLLGMMYEYGRGVPKDLKQAAELYRRAAEKEDDDAARRLKRISQ